MKAHEEEEAVSSATTWEEDEEILQYPFYAEGSKALLDARIDIARYYSLVRAALRLKRGRRRRDDPDEDLDAEIDWALKQADNLVLDCSEIGDDRALVCCSFHRMENSLPPDGQYIATVSFDRTIKLWFSKSSRERRNRQWLWTNGLLDTP